MVHHTSGRYDNAVKEMDTLLHLTHTDSKSIQCKVGKFKEIYK
ncbi:MAG: hypothetical protein SOZ78_08460 [Eubacteriales bacterium]|nr:hypothetical protein [Eubacteriales bacterium]